MRAPPGSASSSSATCPAALDGGTSRPSRKAWIATFTPAAAITAAAAAICRWWACTPPGEANPAICAVPPLAFRSAMKRPSSGLPAKLPSPSALSIRGRSIQTTRPAPMLVCPTSELPICPTGSPTSGPCAASVACGQVAQIRSKFGVRPSATAFASRDGLRPQPSRMHSTTGRMLTSASPEGRALSAAAGVGKPRDGRYAAVDADPQPGRHTDAGR